MDPIYTNFWKWKDKEYRFDIYSSEDFTNLKNVKQVYALVLSKNRNQVLVVHNKNGMWILPGGGVEEGETLLETLIREVKEETNRDIDLSTARPLYYQEVYKKNDSGKWEFLEIGVRYSVIVENDNKFISDPDNGDIVDAKWVNISDLDKYLDWGKTAEIIISLLKNNQSN